MKARTIYAAVFVAGGLTALACAGKPPPPAEPAHVEVVVDAGPEAEAPEPQKSLYERLGKQEGIAKVIETLMKNVSADTKFNKRLTGFKGPKLDKLKKDLVDLICVEAGGPESGADCKYEGRFMKELLGAKSKLKEEEWQALLVGLRNALEEQGVHSDEQQDLASALGKFREDAVEVPKPKPAPKKK